MADHAIDKPQRVICVPINPPVRLFEWCVAGALTAIGAHLILWPTSAEISSFKVAILAFGALKIGALFVLVGWVRLWALERNGRWPRWGWVIRSIGSGCGALVWGQMCVTLYYVPAAGAPSPFIWMYVSLTAAEVYATFRAVRDGF